MFLLEESLWILETNQSLTPVWKGEGAGSLYMQVCTELVNPSLQFIITSIKLFFSKKRERKKRSQPTGLCQVTSEELKFWPLGVSGDLFYLSVNTLPRAILNSCGRSLKGAKVRLKLVSYNVAV